MKKPLIIHSPSLQSLQQRYASAVFTFIFWLLWFVLWTPLITLVGWLMGFDVFYLEIFELEGYEALLADLNIFLLWVALFGGGLGVWALYNYLRFRGVDRRTAVSPVTCRQLADYFELDESVVRQHRDSQWLAVSFDPDGRIVDVKNRNPRLSDSLDHPDQPTDEAVR